MSIIDSREEQAAAKERLTAVSDEQLRVDLEWGVASVEHAEDVTRIHRELQEARRRVAEAETWSALVLGEMVTRRKARAGSLVSATSSVLRTLPLDLAPLIGGSPVR